MLILFNGPELTWTNNEQLTKRGSGKLLFYRNKRLNNVNTDRILGWALPSLTIQYVLHVCCKIFTELAGEVSSHVLRVSCKNGHDCSAQSPELKTKKWLHGWSQRLCFVESVKKRTTIHSHTHTHLEKKNKIQMISFIAFLSRLIESRRPREKSLSQFFNNTAFICGVSTYRWSGGVVENHSEPH